VIVNVDFKSLEVVTAAWLSQDEVMMNEIKAGTDMHEANRVAFNLPSRLVAKVLKFRILYGGTAFSFSKDPDFTPVSKNVGFWEDVIDKYYNKYRGLKKWHDQIIREATTTGYVISPFGRSFKFEMVKKYNGDMVWPVTDIKNYPVQGTGADIVCMSRVMIHKKFNRANLKSKLISTVHDSIVADVTLDEVDTVCKIFSDEIAKTPEYLTKYFGCDFNLPLVGEVSVGPNMLDLQEV
jgi:DNA polymerase I